MTNQDDFFFKYGHGDITLEFPSNMLTEDKDGWYIYPIPPQIPVNEVKKGGKFTVYTTLRPKSISIDKETSAEIIITKSVPVIVTKVKELKRKHRLLIKVKRDKK